ncbi:GntR family transcriptional regulator [Kitasatospora sp. NPDC048540]|uniref:GntR family transcriptional regulator n=1 Tax=unclassified Kitasatospora TaxID=2633591 RepID=UPI000539B33C|nr:GntR family transcriptional regulator [Kitasatospora sp. MBT63]
MPPLAELIRVDRSSPIPLYFQVAERLEALITSGELPAGARLDNEVSLAGELGLSRPTMRQAIQHLVDKGLLVRKRGVGTQVVHTRVRRQVELTSLHDDLVRDHRRPRTEVLRLARVEAAEEVAAALQVAPGAPVWELERLRFADGEPLALLRNHLPVGLCPLSEETLSRSGLYEELRAAGVRLGAAEQSIGARRASAAEARLLGESRGAPLLTMRRTAYDVQGRPVEHGSHLYRPTLYSFECTLLAR